MAARQLPTVFQSAIGDDPTDFSAGKITPSRYNAGVTLRGSFIPQGRLTLTSATPVLTSTVSAAGTIYYTPYSGNGLPVWSGTDFDWWDFTELSNVLANSATGNAGPAAAAANNVYDLFVWSNSGTLTLTRGPTWASGTGGSNTVRGTGAGSTALQRTNGFLTNANAITNGPAAGYGLYVGTIWTNAASANVTVNFGSSAAGGGQSIIGLWNMFNRVLAAVSVRDSTSSWTSGTAAWRAADGNTNNSCIYVAGLAEDGVEFTHVVTAFSGATVGAQAGTGVDSSTVLSAGVIQGSSLNTDGIPMSARYTGIPGLGKHQVYALEFGGAGNGFYGGGSQGLLGTLAY